MEWGEHLTSEKAREMSEEQEGRTQEKIPCKFCGEPQGNLAVHMRSCDEYENSKYAEESDKYGADVPAPDP